MAARSKASTPRLSSIAENPLSPKAPAGEVPLTPLLVVDDGLRRTFIHSFQVKQVLEDKPAATCGSTSGSRWQSGAAPWAASAGPRG